MPAKKVVKRRADEFRPLFEAHPQPMWLRDPKTGHIVSANRALRDLYGYSAAEFESRTPADLEMPGEPQRHQTKSGSTLDVELAVSNVTLSGRKLELAVVRDKTAQRHLEDQLRQSQKMEAVGMLAGGVAHDFNNLLTIINGYSQLLISATNSGDPNRQAVEQILNAGERAAELTNQLLAFSRRQAPKPKVIDLNSLVAGLGVMLRRLIGESIELSLSLESNAGRVRADPGQIEQVLMNLVINARDAMPAGGAIQVSTHMVTLTQPGAGRLQNLRAGRYALLEVRDTGKGMDAATVARLFEPFFTTKPEGRGTGLGLSTVLAIVTRAGGAIDVVSQPGAGAVVRVHLPRVDLPLSVVPETPSENSRGAETILVVEDEDSVRRLVTETLARSGYQVLDAPDAATARRICAGPTHIDLLITDIVLPRSSGRQLAAELSASHPKMRLLYMSGYDMLQEGLPFLQKPFTPAVLSAKVRAVLDPNRRTKRAGS